MRRPKKLPPRPKLIPSTVPLENFNDLKSRHDALYKRQPVTLEQYEALLARFEELVPRLEALEEKLRSIGRDAMDDVREEVSRQLDEHRNDYEHTSNSRY